MKKIIEVVCAGILGVGVFFPTSAKAFVSTLTNINDQTYAITHSNSETLLALRCETCLSSGDPIPPTSPTPNIAVQFLLAHSSLIKQTIKTTWNEAGKGIVAQKIKELLNNRQVSDGVNIYNPSVDIAAISNQQLTVGSQANQVRLILLIPGNYMDFHTTTPSLFGIGLGSYADPEFGVSFDLTVNITISVNELLPSNTIHINDVNVQVSNAHIHGSNATGTLTETIGDFIPGVNFSQTVTSKINQSFDFTNTINKALSTLSYTSLTRNVVTPSTSEGLLQALQAINIDYSVTESQILDWLGNPYSLYPQFAKGTLKLFDGLRLKNKVYLDVIFYNYKKLGGKVVFNSLDGSLDLNILKKAIVEGYKIRDSISVSSFEDIVEY